MTYLLPSFRKDAFSGPLSPCPWQEATAPSERNALLLSERQNTQIENYRHYRCTSTTWQESNNPKHAIRQLLKTGQACPPTASPSSSPPGTKLASPSGMNISCGKAITASPASPAPTHLRDRRANLSATSTGALVQPFKEQGQTRKSHTKNRCFGISKRWLQKQQVLLNIGK